MDLFSPDYLSARARFREAADRLGWGVESHEIAARGPKGEVLTIDVARSGLENESENALVISSGLHGVEGFFGSAVQLGLMERWAENPKTIGSLNVVMLHALNPFGFAWLRRTNEENIDLNRNFLLPGEAFTGSSAGYAALDDLLNPKWPPSMWDPFLPKAFWAMLRGGGISKLRQAVAGGQYDFPKGLFYGGAKPAQTQRLLAANLWRWLGVSTRVIHLDLHSGLGGWARGKLLVDHPLTEAQERRLNDSFGSARWEKSSRAGVSYQAKGSLGNWCANLLSQMDYLYGCAEFGTYSNVKICASLRAENQAQHWAGADDAATLKAKRRLREAFCPEDAGWREVVLDEGRRFVELAVEDLSR